MLSDGDAVPATFFDLGGFDEPTIAGWTFHAEQPSQFHSSHLSNRADWVQAQIPEPGKSALGFVIAILLALLLGGFLRRRY